jgi:hypothetical protein
VRPNADDAAAFSHRESLLHRLSHRVVELGANLPSTSGPRAATSTAATAAQHGHPGRMSTAAATLNAASSVHIIRTDHAAGSTGYGGAGAVKPFDDLAPLRLQPNRGSYVPT